MLIKNFVIAFLLCWHEVLAYILDVSDLFNRMLYRVKNGDMYGVIPVSLMLRISTL